MIAPYVSGNFSDVTVKRASVLRGLQADHKQTLVEKRRLGE